MFSLCFLTNHLTALFCYLFVMIQTCMYL